MSERKIIIITVLGVVLLMILLLSSIAVILFLYQKRVRMFILEVEEIKAKSQQELLRVQLEVQEQTLAHISREIHDNIGQSISLAKFNIGTISVPPNTKMAKKLEDAVNILTKAMDDLRDLSNSLTLEDLRRDGLVKTIDSQVAHVRKAETHQIDFDVTGSYHHLPDQQEIILFRILQEAINNIIRHAKATEITIRLNYQQTAVSLEIIDNGVGFVPLLPNPQNSTPTKGRGLNNMQERARLIEATFRLDSQPGLGCKITILLPLIVENKNVTPNFDDKHSTGR